MKLEFEIKVPLHILCGSFIAKVRTTEGNPVCTLMLPAETRPEADRQARRLTAILEAGMNAQQTE